ncbi:hypothetical protein ACFT8V_30085 [Streptomyces griseoincarnatus]|uniref:hypothetical protein n=1 Tax=unclassified Streptomyces TaxID=2593676 RepID=UPI0018EE96B2|nr:hypothetical protein [Streptomyces sp. I4(2020)]MBJ6613969.1 hypothetical protein [Streptomyces sp. I3(2020)]MBJ6630188.1 hypothetical protein [Streptomyces sp. I4(2020)]
MASESSILRAAWVPDDDPERDWAIAADLAVDWVRQECAEQGAVGVLVLNAFGVEQQIPSLRRFAAEHTVTTPRASRDRVGRGRGPVLAYVPDERTLDFAADLARGSSLAIVESVHGFPLEGWARQLGAIDLTRPEKRPEPIDSELAEAIDRLDFYKNNGFGDQFGKQQAQRILQNLRGAGLLERDVILGALAARGASDRAVRNLGKLIAALDRR